MSNLSYIYKITNIKNNKSYIGQTTNDINLYINNHFTYALEKNSNKYFHKAIRKYGKDQFIWEILFQDYCHPNKLSSLEIFFIAYYNTQKPNSYNISPGGESSWKNNLHSHPNKKEIYKQNGKKISKILNKVNPKTGLTIAQERAIKIAKIRKINNTTNKGQNNPCSKTNMSKEKRIAKAKKSAKTMITKINPETGLTIAQEIGKKSSKTKLLRNKK